MLPAMRYEAIGGNHVTDVLQRSHWLPPEDYIRGAKGQKSQASRQLGPAMCVLMAPFPDASGGFSGWTRT